MPLHKTEAIVLRTIKLGEADKIVTLFTKELGKIKAVAKGARKIKSRFGSSLEPFTHLYSTVFEKRNKSLYRITQADIIHPYYKIREDIDKIIYGLYFLELMDKFLLEGDVNKKVFSLITNILSLLNEGEDIKETFIIFSLKFLKLSGYQYRFNRCIMCGDDPLISFFSPHRGGLVCNDCIRSDRRGALPINKAAALYLEDIQNSEKAADVSAAASSDIKNEAVEVVKGIFAEIIGYPLMTQEFIKEINR